MNEIIEDYYSLTGLLDKLFKHISILLMGVMTLTVLLQILFRYIMKAPLIWTEELSRYLMIWMAFIAASSIIRNWESISVDLFVGKLSPNVQFYIKLFNKIVVFAFCLLIFIISLRIYPKVSASQKAPALRINMLIPQSGVIIGMLLMTLQTISAIILDFKRRYQK